MIERDELAAWLRLLETPKLGRESARRLLSAFGSPDAAIAAPAPWKAREISSIASPVARPQASEAAVNRPTP